MSCGLVRPSLQWRPTREGAPPRRLQGTERARVQVAKVGPALQALVPIHHQTEHVRGPEGGRRQGCARKRSARRGEATTTGSTGPARGASRGGRVCPFVAWSLRGCMFHCSVTSGVARRAPAGRWTVRHSRHGAIVAPWVGQPMEARLLAPRISRSPVDERPGRLVSHPRHAPPLVRIPCEPHCRRSSTALGRVRPGESTSSRRSAAGPAALVPHARRAEAFGPSYREQLRQRSARRVSSRSAGGRREC